MNYTKKMTAVLSVALLLSSFSAFALPSAPAWLNRDNAKSTGWKFLSWVPTIAGLGYITHLALRVHKLEQQKADAAAAVAATPIFQDNVANHVLGKLQYNSDFQTGVAEKVTTRLIDNKKFVDDISANALHSVGASGYVVRALLQAKVHNEQGAFNEAAAVQRFGLKTSSEKTPEQS